MLFFFSALWKWVSEWSVNFFRKKKITNRFQNFLGKNKKHPHFLKNTFFWPFWTFFCGNLLLWRVSGLQTFPRKKKKTKVIFFFPRLEKKKQNSSKSSEWVSDKLFQGNKKMSHTKFKILGALTPEETPTWKVKKIGGALI